MVLFYYFGEGKVSSGRINSNFNFIAHFGAWNKNHKTFDTGNSVTVSACIFNLNIVFLPFLNGSRTISIITVAISKQTFTSNFCLIGILLLIFEAYKVMWWDLIYLLILPLNFFIFNRSKRFKSNPHHGRIVPVSQEINNTLHKNIIKIYGGDGIG